MSSESLNAQELNSSDGADRDYFGQAVSTFENAGIVGAWGDEGDGGNSGSAYLFKELNTTLGTVVQSAKLTASDGAGGDRFGLSVSAGGSSALVAAYHDDDNGNNSGSAYLFQNIDIATGSINESAKLIASDGAAFDQFGHAVSISGGTGLIGATFGDGEVANSGGAYLFQSLDSASGIVNESAKLIATDGASGDQFGYSVSLSGNAALVSASSDDDRGLNSGSAYVFRGIDNASGTISQSAKLIASDGRARDEFGRSVSLSGNFALIGAIRNDHSGTDSGSAYFFHGIDTATGIVSQTAKLAASDGTTEDLFGFSVALSENTGIVGAFWDDDNGLDSGSAYIFGGLDVALGLINESVKLTASDGNAGDQFGSAVSIVGDRFIVGALGGDGVVANSGSAYTGTVSSMTTLDTGNALAQIDAISFQSRVDWIIGQTTSNNHVTLTDGDSAEILSAGKAVYIGDEVGSNDNSLTIAGLIEANEFFVGDVGNFGNQFILDATATHTIGAITLFESNQLLLEGEFTTFSLLDAQLGTTDLFYADGTTTEQITADNFGDLLLTSFDGSTGYTSFTAASAIPEPSAACLMLIGLAGLTMRRRR